MTSEPSSTWSLMFCSFSSRAFCWRSHWVLTAGSSRCAGFAPYMQVWMHPCTRSNLTRQGRHGRCPHRTREPRSPTMRSRAADAAATRLRPAFIAATLLLILLLGFFAYALASSQHQQRKDINKRFFDRARVAATVNESLFSLASSSVRPVDIQRFGGKTVDQQALAQRSAVQQQYYAAILSTDGKVLAKTGAVPADVASHATFKEALKSKSAVYSSLMRGPGGSNAIESAITFPTQFGNRVDVSAGKADALAQFLNSFLSRLPSVAHAKSYVIDRADKVIATPGQKSRPGVPLADLALTKALKQADSGTYDGNRYFAASPINGAPWRIVLSAARDDLYSSVKTTVPWLIFAAFVFVSLGGMLLLWRVL